MEGSKVRNCFEWNDNEFNLIVGNPWGFWRIPSGTRGLTSGRFLGPGIRSTPEPPHCQSIAVWMYLCSLLCPVYTIRIHASLSQINSLAIFLSGPDMSRLADTPSGSVMYLRMYLLPFDLPSNTPPSQAERTSLGCVSCRRQLPKRLLQRRHFGHLDVPHAQQTVRTCGEQVVDTKLKSNTLSDIPPSPSRKGLISQVPSPEVRRALLRQLSLRPSNSRS